MQAVLSQTFDRCDFGAFNRVDRVSAGAHCLAIDMDRAGSAKGSAASKLRTGESKVIAQDPEQRCQRVDVDLGTNAVEREVEPCHGERLLNCRSCHKS